MTRIATSQFGSIPTSNIEFIVSVMEDCYRRLEPHDVVLTDLYIFENSALMDAYLNLEYRELGIPMQQMETSFFALHDAYRGLPRITVCVEKLSVLPLLTQEGCIQHEVGHSVLHGSPEYYFLPIPSSIASLTKRLGTTVEYSSSLLYLTSIAVKDCEVTRLLYERGYGQSQMDFAKHILALTEQDAQVWQAAGEDRQAQVLCLFSRLKDICFAAPLLADEKFGNEIKYYLCNSLSYLPADLATRTFEATVDSAKLFRRSTVENLNILASNFVEKIIDPFILEKK